MLRLKRLASAAFALAILLVAISARAETLSGKVIAIADGDTLTILTEDKERIRVRLQFIDAPEHDQDFGQRARQRLSELVFDKVVTVEATGKDQYGRQLGKVVYRGSDINLEMIKSGLAWHYKYFADREQRDE